MSKINNIYMINDQAVNLKSYNLNTIIDILIDYLYENKQQELQSKTFGAQITEQIQEGIVEKAAKIANEIDKEILSRAFDDLIKAIENKIAAE
jgi:D-alanine-D-alanine ligase-like ATP-grasp enzyme